MTINIRTGQQPEAPVLNVETLKDLSPRDDHKIVGGFRSAGTGCC